MNKLDQKHFIALAVALVLLLSVQLQAQNKNENKSSKANSSATEKAIDPKTSQEEDSADSLNSIKWQNGPAKASMKNIAQINLPEGYIFASGEDISKFLELTGNIPNNREVGVLAPNNLDWFVIFEFSDIGYVKDDEKDKLDADAILESIKKSNELANEERRKRGWPTLDVIGWKQTPKYDSQTNNLEWAILGKGQKEEIVNFNTRLLGRRGVIEANLVIDPKKLDSTVPIFKDLLKSHEFQTGQKYAEYRSGDKIAEYGLVALVTGGAAVAATKLGLFGKFWQFLLLILAKTGKLLILVVVGLGGVLKKIFDKVFNRSSSTEVSKD